MTTTMVATLGLALWLTAALLGMRVAGVGREAAGVWRGPHGLHRVTGLGLVSFLGLGGWLLLSSVTASAVGRTWPGSAVAQTAATLAVNGVMAGGLWLMLRPSNRRAAAGPSERTGCRRTLATAGWALAGLLAVLPAVYLTLSATVAVLKWWSPETEVGHETLKLLAGSDSPFLVVLVVLSAVVVTPLFEELLFRGAVQGFCVSVLSGNDGPGWTARWGGIVASSLVFAGLHAPWSMPAIFVLSVGLGYVYERTGRLAPAVVMHLLFNLISVLQTLTSRGGSG